MRHMMLNHFSGISTVVIMKGSGSTLHLLLLTVLLSGSSAKPSRGRFEKQPVAQTDNKLTVSFGGEPPKQDVELQKFEPQIQDIPAIDANKPMLFDDAEPANENPDMLNSVSFGGEPLKQDVELPKFEPQIQDIPAIDANKPMLFDDTEPANENSLEDDKVSSTNDISDKEVENVEVPEVHGPDEELDQIDFAALMERLSSKDKKWLAKKLKTLALTGENELSNVDDDYDHDEQSGESGEYSGGHDDEGHVHYSGDDHDEQSGESGEYSGGHDDEGHVHYSGDDHDEQSGESGEYSGGQL